MYSAIKKLHSYKYNSIAEPRKECLKNVYILGKAQEKYEAGCGSGVRFEEYVC